MRHPGTTLPGPSPAAAGVLGSARPGCDHARVVAEAPMPDPEYRFDPDEFAQFGVNADVNRAMEHLAAGTAPPPEGEAIPVAEAARRHRASVSRVLADIGATPSADAATVLPALAVPLEEVDRWLAGPRQDWEFRSPPPGLTVAVRTIAHIAAAITAAPGERDPDVVRLAVVLRRLVALFALPAPGG